MRVHVDTNGLIEAVFVDGRHTAARQWSTIATEVARLTRHRTNPVQVVGAWVMTDDPNRRPYYRPGEKLRT